MNGEGFVGYRFWLNKFGTTPYPANSPPLPGTMERARSTSAWPGTCSRSWARMRSNDVARGPPVERIRRAARSGERLCRWKRATSPDAQVFLFGRHTNFQRGDERFPGKSRNGTSKVPNLALAMSSLWAMAGDSRPANSGFSPRPLPIIGVRRVIVQCRAHDDAHRTAALQWRA
jgi:hypothetical protein